MKNSFLLPCGLAALLFSGCLERNKQASPNISDLHTNIIPDSNDPAPNQPQGKALSDWQYEPKNHEIKSPSYTQGEDLVLQLQDYPVSNNPKSEQPLPLLAFAEPDEEKGANAQPFLVNGNPFSGTLVGKYEDKIVLELYFKNGKRVGDYFATDKNGEIYRFRGKKPFIIGGGEGVRKPVIYLYPTTTQKVTVQVDFQGDITHSYPKYPAQGWTVEAAPDGELKDLATGKSYYELFWEGESSYQYQMKTGFVVKGGETAEFLDEKLEILGLNRREANEFITYWLPELEKNSYNLIHFAGQEYQQQAPWRIQPRPDTEIRVFMVYTPLSQPVQIPAQTLQKAKRAGFTAVEWGGKRQNQLIN